MASRKSKKARAAVPSVKPAERPTGPARAPKAKTAKSARRPWPLRLAYWGLVLGLWVGIAGAGLVTWVGAHLPPIQSLDIPKRPPSIEIVDVEGRPLARRGDLAGPPIAIRALPAHVSNAFVAIEDRRFYHHWGVDPLGIARAVVANAMHRGVAQGGSTITQQ